jgi:ribosomal protein S14
VPPTVNVRNTNLLRVITDSNLSWEVHIERTCSRISHNFFIINRLSKILDMNIRRMLYYVVIYPLEAYRIIVQRQSIKALTRTFTLQKRAVRQTAGLKQLELCRHSFRQLRILTVHLLYIQKTILYAKEKCKQAL